MSPTTTYYRAFGTPASAYITFSAVPASGATVTIGSSSYAFGTTFNGKSASECARHLCEAINADAGAYGHEHTSTVVVAAVYARYFGKTVRVIACVPGTAGNSIALSKSGDSANHITVSAAALSGGVDRALPMAMTPTTGATALTLNYAQKTANGSANALAATATKFAGLHILPLAANVADAYLGNATTQSLVLAASVWTAFNPPPMCVGDLNTVYWKGTSGDKIDIYYWS